MRQILFLWHVNDDNSFKIDMKYILFQYPVTVLDFSIYLMGRIWNLMCFPHTALYILSSHNYISIFQLSFEMEFYYANIHFIYFLLWIMSIDAFSLIYFRLFNNWPVCTEPKESKRGRLPITEVANGYKIPCGCWEPKQGLLKE